jgi:hypothetical protein
MGSSMNAAFAYQADVIALHIGATLAKYAGTDFPIIQID